MLKEIFITLVNYYSSDEVTSAKLWQEIEKQYSAKGRHYHNLQHLESMLGELGQCRHLITDRDSILFSLFYHDIIYKPTAKDNEEKSADKAIAVLALINYPLEKAQKCHSQIIATKAHSLNTDGDTNLFTDADLSILGSSWENYTAYCGQIRKEYSIYPDFLYKPGRRKVLEHFLDMKSVYKTGFFIEKYENQAKENMERELNDLL